MRSFLVLAGLTPFLAFPALQGASIVPPGLVPGDTYRLAFITSSTRDATSLNILDYNDFVTAVANSNTELLSLGATWKAIGSTAAVDASENIGASPAPIYGLDGILIANGTADLWDYTTSHAITTDENGVGGYLGFSVWTGTSQNGTGSGLSELGSSFVRVGRSGGGPYWVDDLFAYSNTQQHSMYAISSELTVGPSEVPEPESLSLMLAGTLVLLGMAKRIQRHGPTS